MDEKTTKRLEVICAECMVLWENKDIDVSIRSNALRLYADIYEEMSILEQGNASKGYMRSIMREYDKELLALYGEF